MTTLNTFTTTENVKPTDALKAWVGTLGDGAVAFAYTPSEASILQLELAPNGPPRLADERGKGYGLNQAWSLRGFSARGELRWHHDSNGNGPAAFLTEEAPTPPSGWEKADAGDDAPSWAGHIDRRYILWGSPSTDPQTQLAEGWTRLAAAQMGCIHVPTPIHDKETAVLHAREYLARDRTHGNVYVAAELLRGIGATKQEG